MPEDLPSLLLPRKGRYGLIDYEKAFTPDWTTGADDIFDLRGIDREQGALCKAVFNRPKDWVDIDAMMDADTALDAAEVLRWVGRIAGNDDPRHGRIAAVLTHR